MSYDNEIMYSELKKDYPNGTKFLIEVEIDTNLLDPDELNLALGYQQILSCFFSKEKQDEFRNLTGTNISQIYKKSVFVPVTHTLQDCVDMLNDKVKKIYQEGHPV